jgi:c-di-GMP-binding flagellar brake protein YcgR
MADSGADRRRDIRTSARLPIELAAGGDESLSVSSLNIGAGGVYVEVPRFIEPLTKLSLSMMIPGPTPEEDASLVETEAIVVRVLPERPDPSVDRYEVACAFLDLTDENRDVVNRYILTHRTVAS